ncbi:hypothetical protein M438DRAFT_335659 [Aureobasidium pullulans EXF-150]|uniref:CCHC-type domain-containing protein n=1 Tax=Aureobasidium pullulans EXF-150 TaxID=1043002 RepID=A0A074XPN0_AURPU|nr:uncharacterized protein M438DRAFT_335659 [Aureobasidium pullulans EXF-150]KEQ83932.1 hypothetical protein M438DRAFT_335659 [Aureobasidium pullulans EXF-150]
MANNNHNPGPGGAGSLAPIPIYGNQRPLTQDHSPIPPRHHSQSVPANNDNPFNLRSAKGSKKTTLAPEAEDENVFSDNYFSVPGLRPPPPTMNSYPSPNTNTTSYTPYRTQQGAMQLQVPSASHAIIESFSGSDKQDAKRWLGRFERELHRTGTNTPLIWLQEFNYSLEGEAAEWADTDYQVSSILSNDAIDEHNAAHYATMVRNAFLERFKRVASEQRNPIPDIQELKQGPGETLRQYYQRAFTLLCMAGGEDDPNHASVSVRSLVQLTKERFLAGLVNHDLRLRLIRLPSQTASQTLGGVLADAEACIRQMNVEKKWQEESERESQRLVLHEFATNMMRGGKCSNDVIEMFKAHGISVEGAKTATIPHRPAQPQASQGQQWKPAESSSAAVQSVVAQPGPRSATPHSSSKASSGPDDLAWQHAREVCTAMFPTFDPFTSACPYVTGQRRHQHSNGNPLCCGCGTPGHIKTVCDRDQLSPPEIKFLYEFCTKDAQLYKEAKDKRPAREAGVLLVDVTSSEEDPEYIWEDVRSDSPTSVKVLNITEEVDVLINGQETGRKRTRRNQPEEEEEEEQPPAEPPKTPDNRPVKSPKKRVVGRQKKPLNRITAMLTEAPVDVLTILKNSNVVLPITHLAQLSPYFRDETKRLFGMPRNRRVKKTGQPATPTEVINVSNIHSEVQESIQKWNQRDRTHRAFGLPAKVWIDGQDKAIVIPRDHTAADQGSDINLIYPTLMKALKLEYLPISQLNLPNIRMTMPNGARCELKYWTHFNVQVENITRRVWAFVCPEEGRSISLLLGIPYLESVDAHIRVRESVIEIGDKSKGESVTSIAAPTRNSVAPFLEAVEANAVEGDDSSEGVDDTSDEESDSDASVADSESSDDASSTEDFQ